MAFKPFPEYVQGKAREPDVFRPDTKIVVVDGSQTFYEPGDSFEPAAPNIIPWKVTPSDFNVIIGDGLSEEDALANGAAVQAAWDYAGQNGRSFLHVGGPIEVAGELWTPSNFVFERSGASSWLKPRWAPGTTLPWNAKAKVGGFILVRGDATLFVDPWIDGELMEDDAHEYGQARGGTLNTIILSADASPIDGHYIGKIPFVFDGPGSGTPFVKFVTAYDGATRTCTVSPAFSSAPDATSLYDIGTNTVGIGAGGGAHNTKLFGGRIRNIRSGVPTAGGKAFTCQQGSRGTIVDGLIIDNCKYGIFMQGWIGERSPGDPRSALQDTFTNLVMRDCGTALTYFGGAPTDDEFRGSMETMSSVVSNVTAYECGHDPERFLSAESVDTHMKNGVFSFARGHNVSLRNLRCYNSNTLVYPTDYDKRVGYGLTGDIGAVVWFNGRSIDIDGLHVEGNYDALVRVGRVRAAGDDGPSMSPDLDPPIDAASPYYNYNVSIRNVKHRGSLGLVFELGEHFGYKPTDVHLSLDIHADVGTVTTGLVDPRAKLYVNSRMDVSTRDELNSSYKRVSGTFKQIWYSGNAFSEFPEGITNLNVPRTVKKIDAPDTTNDYDVLLEDNGLYLYNLGAAGSLNYNLPSGVDAVGLAGLRYTLAGVQDGKTVSVVAQPGGQIHYRNRVPNSITATDSNASVTLVSVSSTIWTVVEIAGAWDIATAHHYVVPTTGGSIGMAQGEEVLILDPAGTISTFTVTLPTKPVDGHRVTIKSSQQITTLTINPAAGDTLVGWVAGTLAARGAIDLVYDIATLTWF